MLPKHHVRLRARVLLAAGAIATSVVGACSDKTQRATPPPPPPPSSTSLPAGAAPGSPSSPLRDPHRFDCAADADCKNSCAYGAVNAAWYTRNEGHPEFRECQDGCANQISAPPRCEGGQCVAYQVDPRDPKHVSRRDHCTRVERR